MCAHTPVTHTQKGPGMGEEGAGNGGGGDGRRGGRSREILGAGIIPKFVVF